MKQFMTRMSKAIENDEKVTVTFDDRRDVLAVMVGKPVFIVIEDGMVSLNGETFSLEFPISPVLFNGEEYIFNFENYQVRFQFAS